jgi:hypothetical protein
MLRLERASLFLRAYSRVQMSVLWKEIITTEGHRGTQSRGKLQSIMMPLMSSVTLCG